MKVPETLAIVVAIALLLLTALGSAWAMLCFSVIGIVLLLLNWRIPGERTKHISAAITAFAIAIVSAVLVASV